MPTTVSPGVDGQTFASIGRLWSQERLGWVNWRKNFRKKEYRPSTPDFGHLYQGQHTITSPHLSLFYDDYTAYPSLMPEPEYLCICDICAHMRTPMTPAHFTNPSHPALLLCAGGCASAPSAFPLPANPFPHPSATHHLHFSCLLVFFVAICPSTSEHAGPVSHAPKGPTEPLASLGVNQRFPLSAFRFPLSLTPSKNLPQCSILVLTLVSQYIY